MPLIIWTKYSTSLVFSTGQICEWVSMYVQRESKKFFSIEWVKVSTSIATKFAWIEWRNSFSASFASHAKRMKCSILDWIGFWTHENECFPPLWIPLILDEFRVNNFQAFRRSAKNMYGCRDCLIFEMGFCSEVQARPGWTN